MMVGQPTVRQDCGLTSAVLHSFYGGDPEERSGRAAAFDRVLIAQALAEQVPILTADRGFDSYDVEVVRA